MAAVGVTPPCPVCAAPTIRLTARQGRRAGKDFYGCSRHRATGCPGVINIDDEDTSAPAPGVTAQRTFERYRRIHRAKLMALAPFIACVTVAFAGAAFFLVLPMGPLFASAAAAGVGAASVFGFGRLPREARYWGRGARGEVKTAADLEPLIRRGFVMLHDRRLPGSRGNIDHILIGPSGVYVVETKNLSGPIEVANDTLFVSDNERQWYVDQLYREAVTCQIALSDILNPLRLTVTPVLCVQGARPPWLDHSVAGVRLLSGSQLRRLAERSDLMLSADQVQQLARVADKRFRPMHSWEY